MREVDIRMLKEGWHPSRLGGRKFWCFPSYINRSLESSQNFLFKYLSVAVLDSGCITQLIVALRSLSRLGEALSPSSAQTRLLVATCICSSRLMSAEVVRIAASPLNRKNGSRTKENRTLGNHCFEYRVIWMRHPRFS